MNNEEIYIKKCKSLIEQKLAWGDSEQWQSQDFEALSEKIFEETNVSLSSSTLKRIWGKVRYDSSPHLTTLNTLAQFVGHENWRTFVSQSFTQENLSTQEDTVQEVVTQSLPTQSVNAIRVPTRKPAKKALLISGLFAFLCVLLAFWAFQKKNKVLTYSNINFTSKPVTLGIPNTVIFQYNAADSNADSVFIQQSWDSQRRFKVEKEQKEYTSTYYYPGYFRAKLILNDSIVREHDVFIETDGWLGTINKGDIPIYLPKDKVQKDGFIGITAADFISQNIHLQEDVIWTSLFNVQKSNTVPSENFTFEIEIKNTFDKGNGVCQHTKIVLLCTEGVHVIPLSIKGCVGELNLVLGNETIEGKTKDLSTFGVDFSDWVRLRCEVKNRHTQIFIHDKLAYKGMFEQNVGLIVGTKILFAGTGEVRNMRLSK